jgi:hypothetical protein
MISHTTASSDSIAKLSAFVFLHDGRGFRTVPAPLECLGGLRRSRSEAVNVRQARRFPPQPSPLRCVGLSSEEET